VRTRDAVAGMTTTLLDAMEATLDMQLNRRIACPNYCGELVLGKEFKLHLAERCRFREQVCWEGCGQKVQGELLDSGLHFTECPMAVYLTRAEVGLRENALKEVKQAIAGAYSVRDTAFALMRARNELTALLEWPTERCRVRVQNIEILCREVTIRLRRRSKERLVYAIQKGEMCPVEDVDERRKQPRVPMNAAKLWNSMDEELMLEGSDKGSRPWDLYAPAVESVVEILQEAAVCTADVQLRRQCEKLLLSMIRRFLQAALVTEDGTILVECLDRAQAALQAIELENLGLIPQLLRQVETAIHHVTLRHMDDTCEMEHFFNALRDGDVNLCSVLLGHEKANPSAPEPRSGLPPIIVAAKRGDIPMINVLLEHRADVNARCEVDGLSALHWAAQWRHVVTVEALLGRGANPRLKDWRGQDPLMKLLRRSIDKPALGCTTSWTVRNCRKAMPGQELPGSGFMSVAVAKETAETSPDCIGFCLASADALQPESRCWISFLGADRQNQQCAAVSSRGASPKIKQGTTADSALLELEQELANEGQRLDTSSPRTSRRASGMLGGAAPWTWYVRVPAEATHDVRMLLAAGADCQAQDDGGLTALHHHMLSAPCRGSLPVVSLLIKSSADVNHRDVTDRHVSPFLVAIGSKRADLVRLMIKEAFPPPDLDAMTVEGTCALALAEEKGALEVARVLREAGASDWKAAEFVLGANTYISFDSRVPVRT
jgi:ankyrin repeat protein